MCCKRRDDDGRTTEISMTSKNGKLASKHTSHHSSGEPRLPSVPSSPPSRMYFYIGKHANTYYSYHIVALLLRSKLPLTRVPHFFHTDWHSSVLPRGGDCLNCRLSSPTPASWDDEDLAIVIVIINAFGGPEKGNKFWRMNDVLLAAPIGFLYLSHFPFCFRPIYPFLYEGCLDSLTLRRKCLRWIVCPLVDVFVTFKRLVLL